MTDTLELTQQDGSTLSIDLTNVEQIEAALAILLQDIETIQNQLGNRNKLDANGQRLAGQDYWTWREAANFARRKKMGQYRILKQRRRDILQARYEASRPIVVGDSDTIAVNLTREQATFLRTALGYSAAVALDNPQTRMARLIDALLASALTTNPEPMEETP